MYTRLNHLNVTLSYNATLSAVTDVSKLHKMPIQTWISEGVTFKFAGDNVDKMKGVTDIRIDHQSELQHMYSASNLIMPLLWFLLVVNKI